MNLIELLKHILELQESGRAGDAKNELESLIRQLEERQA